MTRTNQTSGELASYYFHQGTNYRAYEYLGCHFHMDGETFVYTFRTWAPNAALVEVAGDFNRWNPAEPMVRITDMGVWEYVLRSDRSLDGQNYKYRITSGSGVHLKADPYARYSETLRNTSSKIYEEKPFKWTDSLWLARRMKTVAGKGKKQQNPDRSEFFSAPMNIYEVHLGSWKTRDGLTTKDGENYLNYREIADELAPYAKQMGYTHVELLPIAEHPFDGSWGYQVCGYYSPTSRFGTPEDFRYFVNKLHTMGIGVILDWVPAHFPKDEHGLYEFDGGPLYEYQGHDRMEHKIWGTRFFDVARNEVECFLISNALYWLREFHIDGLRVDAVASMLYLDFDRNPGEWIPNENGDNKNLESIAFFRKLNTVLFAEFPDALMIAEESTDWKAITKPVSEGGLGFNFKWNMGWSNDTFDYIMTDPLFRKHKHERLTFPMMYAFDENFILPVSHDEVVHGKLSLLDKSHGDYFAKFAGTRLFMAYQMTYPGKKLMFMGSEYGPFREWDYENQLEWFMLDYDMHKKLHGYTAELNRFYLENRELWELDFTWDGFEWLLADMRELNIIAYRRMDKKGRELVVLLNFAPVDRRGFILPGLTHKAYREAFASDDAAFGGTGMHNEGVLDTVPEGEKRSLKLNLPGLSAIILRPVSPVRRAGKSEQVKI
ncbi:MAG: 1,4-alpha-glucan branching protein GlgB [Ruminococcaceae bacterium]|nr:1,4-alpha-glucan branching protein GlgB [Oscillospiraceae bacterium]